MPVKKVVFQGVETEEQSRLLKWLPRDEMQGYLNNKPVPADAVKARFLRSASRLFSSAISRVRASFCHLTIDTIRCNFQTHEHAVMRAVFTSGIKKNAIMLCQ